MMFIDEGLCDYMLSMQSSRDVWVADQDEGRLQSLSDTGVMRTISTKAHQGSASHKKNGKTVFEKVPPTSLHIHIREHHFSCVGVRELTSSR